MPTARPRPLEAKLREAVLLLAQDARDSSSGFEPPVRMLLEEIAARERTAVPAVAAWLRGQLAEPDPPAERAVAPRPWTEAEIRLIVRDEIRATAAKS